MVVEGCKEEGVVQLVTPYILGGARFEWQYAGVVRTIDEYSAHETVINAKS